MLLPIAFGMLLVNLYPSIMAPQSTELLTEAQCAARDIATSGHATQVIDGVTYYENPTYGGLLYYLYQGVKLGIYPPLIFLGIGCMTDFGPLISNPKSLILGAAAQIGIFVTFTGAIFLGFTAKEAGAIGIIGGADGPTAISLQQSSHLTFRFNCDCRIFIYGARSYYSAAYYESSYNKERAFCSYGTASSCI